MKTYLAKRKKERKKERKSEKPIIAISFNSHQLAIFSTFFTFSCIEKLALKNKPFCVIYFKGVFLAFHETFHICDCPICFFTLSFFIDAWEHG